MSSWPASLNREPARDGFVEAERSARHDVTGAAQRRRLLVRTLARKRWHLAVAGCDAALVASFQHGMSGDQPAVLEDPDLVGQGVDLDDPATRGIRHAVEIAADAHHAFVRDPPLELEDGVERHQRERL